MYVRWWYSYAPPFTIKCLCCYSYGKMEGIQLDHRWWQKILDEWKWGDAGGILEDCPQLAGDTKTTMNNPTAVILVDAIFAILFVVGATLWALIFMVVRVFGTGWRWDGNGDRCGRWTSRSGKVIWRKCIISASLACDLRMHNHNSPRASIFSYRFSFRLPDYVFLVMRLIFLKDESFEWLRGFSRTDICSASFYYTAPFMWQRGLKNQLQRL